MNPPTWQEALTLILVVLVSLPFMLRPRRRRQRPLPKLRPDERDWSKAFMRDFK